MGREAVNTGSIPATDAQDEPAVSRDGGSGAN
jgi:hypothetical protein